jgi:hypothetical protein
VALVGDPASGSNYFIFFSQTGGMNKLGWIEEGGRYLTVSEQVTLA